MADDDVELTKSEQRARKRRERAEADAALSAPASALKWLIMGVIAAAVLVFAIYLGSNHNRVATYSVVQRTEQPGLGIVSYRVSTTDWGTQNSGPEIIRGVWEENGKQPVTVDIYCRDGDRLGALVASGGQTSDEGPTILTSRPGKC